MVESDRTSFSTSVDAAIRKLVSVEHFHAASVVSMPVVYPSGASVVLEVSHQGGRVFISDRGGGYQEADYIGASRYFSREATRVAAEAGISFDGRDMFVVEVPLDAVAGAMVIVASCSANAANTSALKAGERAEKLTKEVLFDRLSGVYGAYGFDRDAEIIGASNHKWRVDALVKSKQKNIIFNSVTKAYVSATGTAAKFHDFARLDIAPRRVAVVTSMSEVGDWIGVLASASDAVIEVGAANDRYINAAKVA